MNSAHAFVSCSSRPRRPEAAMRCGLRLPRGPRHAFLANCALFVQITVLLVSFTAASSAPRVRSSCSSSSQVKASFSSSRAFGCPDVVMRVASDRGTCAEPAAHSVHSMPARNSPRAPPAALTCSPWRRVQIVVLKCSRWLAFNMLFLPY